MVVALPEGSLWIMIPVNFVLAAGLIIMWSKAFTLGGGRVGA